MHWIHLTSIYHNHPSTYGRMINILTYYRKNKLTYYRINHKTTIYICEECPTCMLTNIQTQQNVQRINVNQLACANNALFDK